MNEKAVVHFADRTVTIADADARADVVMRSTARQGSGGGTGSPSGCAFTVTPTLLEFSKMGGPQTGGRRFSINTAQGCAWSAAADAGWMSLFTPLLPTDRPDAPAKSASRNREGSAALAWGSR